MVNLHTGNSIESNIKRPKRIKDGRPNKRSKALPDHCEKRLSPTSFSDAAAGNQNAFQVDLFCSSSRALQIRLHKLTSLLVISGYFQHHPPVSKHPNEPFFEVSHDFLDLLQGFRTHTNQIFPAHVPMKTLK